jgi:hypothetical protein
MYVSERSFRRGPPRGSRRSSLRYVTHAPCARKIRRLRKEEEERFVSSVRRRKIALECDLCDTTTEKSGMSEGRSGPAALLRRPVAPSFREGRSSLFTELSRPPPMI